MLIDTNYQIDWPTLAVVLANLLVTGMNFVSTTLLHQKPATAALVSPALPTTPRGSSAPPEKPT